MAKVKTCVYTAGAIFDNVKFVDAVKKRLKNKRETVCVQRHSGIIVFCDKLALNHATSAIDRSSEMMR